VYVPCQLEDKVDTFDPLLVKLLKTLEKVVPFLLIITTSLPRSGNDTDVSWEIFGI